MGHPVLHSSERAADFPVMAEWIGDAADAPSVFVGHGIDRLRAGFDCAIEDRIGIGHREDEAGGDAGRAVAARTPRFTRSTTALLASSPAPSHPPDTAASGVAVSMPIVDQRMGRHQ